MDSRDYEKMLDKCIYDYLVKKGMHETAEAFANETDVGTPTNGAIKSPEGFLDDWWDEFYSMFSSNQAKHAQDPSEAGSSTISCSGIQKAP